MSLKRLGCGFGGLDLLVESHEQVTVGFDARICMQPPFCAACRGGMHARRQGWVVLVFVRQSFSLHIMLFWQKFKLCGS